MASQRAADAGAGGANTAEPAVTFPTGRYPQLPDDPGQTLSVVLAQLGPQVVTVLHDSGTDGLVGEVMIGGPGEPVPSGDGVVLLLPGVDHPTERTNQLLRAAAASGCTAVVVKGDPSRLDELATVAVEAGLTLLGVPADMAWRHLESLFEAGRSAAGQGADASYDHVGAGDVFSLANAIASAVGGAVTIEDTERHVIAYSNIPGQEIDNVRRDGILGRVGPEGQRTTATYRAVTDSETALVIPSPLPDVAERLAVAVRVGTQVIGTIWAISDRPPLQPGAAQFMVAAARTAAIHLMRARAQVDPDRLARSELLRSLLDGSGPTRGVRAQLGLRRGAPACVFAVCAGNDLAERRLHAARMVDLVDLYVGAWHPSAVSVVESGTVYALLPLQSTQSRERLMGLAADIARAVERSAGVEPLVAVGPAAHAMRDVQGARTMADRMLQVLEHVHPDTLGREGLRLASAEEMRASLVLQALSEQALVTDQLRLDPVTAIMDHDAEQGTDYAATLLAWFSSFGDAARVADELVVHVNTVRYRIRRAQEMFGLDFRDPDQLLCTWLQLRLLVGRD
ncbi:PucR family transcriptional regulator [Ruania rhizosphaerae]|uniref:PucR family transcriptional regulator n=1 Tax=Ruania rhizosphaerae TaxID=1840413 RepID=UPI001359F5B8|nr:PucR family transcriptional regulator [Ruania rhizosphaerae]